jgi:hypothetical protein
MEITEYLEYRFWSRVIKTGSCWLWQGPFLKSGKNLLDGLLKMLY